MIPLVYKGAGGGTCPVAFDEVAHEYRLRGKWRPGATRVLADNGYSKGSRFFTAESRQRGKAVHYATLLVDENCPDATTLDEVLDILDLDERIHPYLAGYLLFKREKQFTPIHHEVLVYSDLHHVCGHFDVWGTTPKGSRLVELKTWANQGPTVKPAATLQVAGYRYMARECLGLESDVAETLALPGDNSYREYIAEPNDEGIFLANCITWWHRKSKGLIEGGTESEVELAA